MLLKRWFQDLPPVARRDAEIQALRAERGRPSFFYKLRETARIRAAQTEQGHQAPVWELNDKASGYRFALSHGVPIPRVYGEYACARDIDWSRLPDEFVVKAIAGTASRAVLPLATRRGGYRDLLSATTSEISTSQEIVTRLETMHDEGIASAELIVEELLRAPSGAGLDVLPDYKLFCFHGVVGLILVVGRRSRGSGGQMYRYLNRDGTDLGDARPGLPPADALPVPLHLEALASAGETLSAAIMSPFVRIDMYERQEGIVFGEITPAPGGDHVMRPDVDVALGELWEQAQMRLENRAIDAGIRQVVFGAHDHGVLVTDC